MAHPFPICAFSGNDRVKLGGGSKVCNTIVERDLRRASVHVFVDIQVLCVCDCEGRVGIELCPDLWTQN